LQVYWFTGLLVYWFTGLLFYYFYFLLLLAIEITNTAIAIKSITKIIYGKRNKNHDNLLQPNLHNTLSITAHANINN
jgi:hypothetical protein